jgi:IS5 family transposase
VKQLTLATNDFERFRKPTRREKFLAEMNEVVPWAELVALIEPYYPKAGDAGGRPAVGLERMLRMHLLQLWFNLSDPAVEEALYESTSMRALCRQRPGPRGRARRNDRDAVSASSGAA